jgi:hypothetical protein
VKRSGRDEPIQVVIHICMEAMLGIPLYSYLYLELAKMLCLMSPLQQNWRRRQNRFYLEDRGVGRGGRDEGQRGGDNPTMYTHMNK